MSWKYKLSFLSLFIATHAILYIYPNLSPPRPPLQLPLYHFEQEIPLIPWTFFIYLSDYVLGVAVVLLIEDLNTFNAYARTAFLGLALCGIFFYFCPTTYPRPFYPPTNNILTDGAMKLVSIADSPHNCFPSLHVSLAGISAWAVRGSRRLSVLFWIWAIAVFLSTLTTKQHYFIDIVGGLVVIVTVIWLNWLLFERRARAVLKTQ